MGKWIDFRELRQALTFERIFEKYNVRLKMRAGGKQAVGLCPLPSHTGERKKETFSANLEKKITSDSAHWTSEFQAMEQAQSQVNQELSFLNQQIGSTKA